MTEVPEHLLRRAEQARQTVAKGEGPPKIPAHLLERARASRLRDEASAQESTHSPDDDGHVVVAKSVIGGLTDNARRWKNRAKTERNKRQKWRKRALAAEAALAEMKPLKTGVHSLPPDTRTNEERSAARQRLAEDIAGHIATHAWFEVFDKEEAVIEAVRVLTNDIGAAQAYLYAIGLEIDLYDKTINLGVEA